MGLFALDAITRLALASASAGDATHTLLVAAGASALGLLAVSSDASRLWVQTQRLPSRVREDTLG